MKRHRTPGPGRTNSTLTLKFTWALLTLALFVALSMQAAIYAQQATAGEKSVAAASVIVTSAATSTSVLTSSSANGSSPAATEKDERYRIGPGDVIEIRIFKRPEISRDAIRVDRNGMIRMPLIADEIKAACHTEGELSAEIATRYLKYLRNPQVDVFVKEFNSQPVAVIGAVHQPGRFQLQRPVRLLELLTLAGGPGPTAGQSVQIVHADTGIACEAGAVNTTTASSATENSATGLVTYNLAATLKGGDDSNPYLRPGDTVSVLEAEQAFVVGNVLRPSPITLKEPITVSRAIAMAGGTMPDTKSDKVRIIRQIPGSATKTEMIVDLQAIDKRRAEDVQLQSGDIVNVPTSGGKRIIRSLIGTIAPTVGSLPIQVIR